MRLPTHLMLRLHRDRRGLAILEFALIVPILILLSAVAFDVVRYIMYLRKIELAASTMADLMARSDTGKTSQNEIFSISRTQLVIFPEAMKVARDNNTSVWTKLKWTLSGVQFKSEIGCQSNCTYTPYVAWTSGVGRPCGVPLTSTPDTAKPSPTTLPSDTFGPGFLVVADVVFTYTPIIAQSIIGTVDIAKSFYVAPRYVPSIAFDPSAGTGLASACAVP